MNSKQILLDTFPDNQSQLISAVDLRRFVTAIYDEASLKFDIVDNLQSTNSYTSLSANQGRILKKRIDALKTIQDEILKRLDVIESKLP